MSRVVVVVVVVIIIIIIVLAYSHRAPPCGKHSRYIISDAYQNLQREYYYLHLRNNKFGALEYYTIAQSLTAIEQGLKPEFSLSKSSPGFLCTP